MNTGPQYTGPQHPEGQGGRGGALLVGGIAFAVVFLLIVGVTVGYLVLRTSSGSGGKSSTTSAVSTPDPAETTEPSEEPTTEATPEKERLCWNPMGERTSSNPSGRLRGGGLEFVPPPKFDNRLNSSYLAFTTDVQTAAALVEANWVSSLIVGKVEWQPGVEYPGDKAASERILDCLYGNSGAWGDTSQRSLHDKVTESVTVAGMPGYRTTAVLKFGKHNLTKTDSTALTVVVVDTPEGPSVFASEIAVGVTEHEQGAEEAYNSLSGLSG